MYGWMYVCICVCVCVCMYVCMFISGAISISLQLKCILGLWDAISHPLRADAEIGKSLKKGLWLCTSNIVLPKLEVSFCEVTLNSSTLDEPAFSLRKCMP